MGRWKPWKIIDAPRVGPAAPNRLASLSASGPPPPPLRSNSARSHWAREWRSLEATLWPLGQLQTSIHLATSAPIQLALPVFKAPQWPPGSAWPTALPVSTGRAGASIIEAPGLSATLSPLAPFGGCRARGWPAQWRRRRLDSRSESILIQVIDLPAPRSNWASLVAFEGGVWLAFGFRSLFAGSARLGSALWRGTGEQDAVH